MKVEVEFLGLPDLSNLIGRRSEQNMDGKTVSDLVSHLLVKYGEKVRKYLLNASGDLDMVIQIMVNDEGYLKRDEYPQFILKKNDNVKFFLMVGGG